jgi:hypothetical protein
MCVPKALLRDDFCGRSKFNPRQAAANEIPLPGMTSIFSLADTARFKTYTLPIDPIQVFGLFRDFGEPEGPPEQKANRVGSVPPPGFFLLKPKGNSTAHRTTSGTDLGKYFSVVGTRLHVHQISRVEHCFSTNR